MAKLSANTTLLREDTLEVVSLAAGDEVPDWATGLVGDHLIEDEQPKRAPARRVAKSDSDEG